jgi:hypothetical protein
VIAAAQHAGDQLVEDRALVAQQPRGAQDVDLGALVDGAQRRQQVFSDAGARVGAI